MADGQQRSYSTNANKAAATAPDAQSGGCPACVKTGLPILLVRPGLADAQYASKRQVLSQPLLDRHVAGPALTFGGYVMRTLRAGYVMAYYETPHTAELKASGGWQAYQVSDGGYLSPYPLNMIEWAGQKVGDAFTCQRSAAYATAMLMVIPEAKKAGKIWIGYSDHPWSAPVRKFYAGNIDKRNARMTMIEAASAACTRAIPLTEENVQGLIADYDQAPPDNFLLGTPYPPLAMKDGKTGTAGVRPESATDLIVQAQALIRSCKGAYSIDQVKIVSVPDAVGMTAETANARLTQCNSAQSWLYEKGKENEQRPWRLQTALSIEGLLKEIDYRNEAQKQRVAGFRQLGLDGKKVTPLEFDRMMEAGELPPGSFSQLSGSWGLRGEWIPDGYVMIGLQSDQELDNGTADLKEDVLAKLGKDGNYPFRGFLEKYRKMVDTDKQKLAQVELDHKAWIQSDARKLVTMHDCARTVPMDGLHFASIVADVTNGGAMTENGLEWYAGFVHENPEEADAILTQAMLGNQDAFFKTFTAKAISKQLKNLLKIFEETNKVTDTSQLKLDQRLVKSFPFFDKTVALLPALRMLQESVANVLVGISGGVLLGLMKRKKISTMVSDKFERLFASIANTAKPGSVFTTQLRFDLALAYWRAADKQLRTSGQQKAAESARRAASNAQRIAGTQTGRVKSLVLAGSLSMALQMPESLARQTVTVWRVGGQVTDEAKLWGKATADALRSGNPAFNAAVAVLGAISLAKLPEKLVYGSERERQIAVAGVISSGMSVIAAAFELGAAVYQEVEKNRGVAAAVGDARKLKLAAGGLSTAIMVVEAFVAFLAIKPRFKTGDYDAGIAYGAQAILFTGSAVATWMGASATYAGVTSAGVVISWTGLGFILAVLGLCAGYLALAVQDTPTEEWVAKSIWGVADPDNKWGSPQREQEELNKLLLGIKVELSYSTQWFKSLGSSAAAAESWSPMGQSQEQRIIWKEVEVRLWIPRALRTELHYGVTLTLIGNDGVATTVYSYLDGMGQQQARLPGLDEVQLDDKNDKDVVLISVSLDGTRFRSAQAEVLLSELEESSGGRNLLVQQILED